MGMGIEAVFRCLRFVLDEGVFDWLAMKNYCNFPSANSEFGIAALIVMCVDLSEGSFCVGMREALDRKLHVELYLSSDSRV